jgi:tetratricopeptide (TPR) repeat protein
MGENAARSQQVPEAVSRYVQAVHQAEKQASADLFLACLLARDAVERLLADLDDPAIVTEVAKADEALRRLRPRLSRQPQLTVWRRMLKPGHQAWWWFPDWTERAIYLLALFSVPFSLAVAIDFARKVGGEGIGIESALPIATTALGSVSLGSLLSRGFRDRLTSGLDRQRWPRGTRLVISVTILALLVATALTWRLYPAMSRHYEKLGARALGTAASKASGQLDLGRIYLERAIRFDPTNTRAHYELGGVYEDLLDEEGALAQYRIAFAAGLDEAYNNLGRLYLHRHEYDKAAFVLQTSLAAAGRSSDTELRYGLLKNLGWARLGQKRYAEGKALLLDAIALFPDRPQAHCLLAKASTGLDDREAATREWTRCLGSTTQGDLTDPDADVWVGEASEFLSGPAANHRP